MGSSSSSRFDGWVHGTGKVKGQHVSPDRALDVTLLVQTLEASMAQPQQTTSIEPSEYLALERASEDRHEYLDGQMFAMSGASRRHNLITTNLVVSLHTRLVDRPCEVYSSDMRVKVSTTGLYTYPDVVVTCGEPRFEDDEVDTLLNPTALVEVLSPSTADYDRGQKFEHYRALDSSATVLFVAQDRPSVLRCERRAGDERQGMDSWVLSEFRDLQGSISMPDLGIELALTEIYSKVLRVE